MDRRDFIKLGALGAVSASGVACGVPPAREPLALTSLALDGFLRNLDSGLKSITNPLSTVLKATLADPFTLNMSDKDHLEDLYRDSLRSMLLVGSIADLPPETRSDPAVQQRLWDATQEMDAAVLGMAAYLEKLPEDERRRVQDKLRERPDLPMAMAEALDDDCAKIGISTKRRMHLRSVAVNVGWQMRAQPLSTLVDEHVELVRKMAARQHQVERARVLAAPPVELHRGPGPGKTLIVAGVAGAAVGGLLLGLAGGGGGPFVATAGVVLLTAGLITIIVGLILLAARG